MFYRFRFLPENIQLFNGNILDNIILGDQADEKKLQELLVLGFDQFINSLPHGFATLVGEEGINLSGGQKQLLAWMRALYHDPQFLILDEPTSSLDKENRKFIYNLIQKLKSKKMVLVIAIIWKIWKKLQTRYSSSVIRLLILNQKGIIIIKKTFI